MLAKAKILFIHGGGEGSYNYDRPLTKFVGEQVDDPATAAYPKLNGLEFALESLVDDGQAIGILWDGRARCRGVRYL